MKYHPHIEQGTREWLRLHLARVTASTLHHLITPGTWKLREGEAFRAFVYRKAAEKWRNCPILDYAPWTSEHRLLKEEAAIAFAARTYGYQITKSGFCETDDGLCGCSPDGLIGDRSGIEMKCPEPTNHVRYLCEAQVPRDYLTQVHGALYVTGRPEWVFYSYARGFPPLHLVVPRDETIIRQIDAAVKTFHSALTEALGKMRPSTAALDPAA